MAVCVIAQPFHGVRHVADGGVCQDLPSESRGGNVVRDVMVFK